MNRWVVAIASCVLAVTSYGVCLAAKAPDGKPVFLKYKCNSCHSIEAAGIVKKAAQGEGETKKKPPDLSGVGLEKKAEWIIAFLQKKEKLDGEFHIKKFRGTESELKTLAAWLETMKDEKAAHKGKEKTEDQEKNEKNEKNEKSEDGKSGH